MAELALRVEAEAPPLLDLVVRFESSSSAAVLAPAEVAWTGTSGVARLVHLPERVAAPRPADDPWPSGLSAASPPLRVAVDGSTWDIGGAFARVSFGPVAPLRKERTLRRRRVRGRSLCPWRNETPLDKLAGTPAGELHIDVLHGLFAFAAAEPPTPWSAPASGPLPAHPPPNVTVDAQEGRSDHVGSVPAARPWALEGAPAPATRLVSRSGGLGEDAAAARLALPLHATLTDALAAAIGEREVIELVESATWPEERLVFPPSPPGLERELVIRAADRARPVVRLAADSDPGTASYHRLSFLGIGFEGAALDLPPSERLDMQHCSLLSEQTPMSARLLAGGTLTVDRCLMARVSVSGGSRVVVLRSVLDAGAPASDALVAEGHHASVDRSTVVGALRVRSLDASESIFEGAMVIDDRFRGCVRYCRVPPGALLPRRHRCIEGTRVDLLSRRRTDAAYARISERAPSELRTGAADGGELGVFHDAGWGPLIDAVRTRLAEYTPAGLRTGLIRRD